ncbi:glycosyltransferase [Shewanella corallii]|uniref:Glycosyltransferase n=1 Tax=Shewanella corallii TaxID=560080 RepID=A0ABT0N6F4_9GAMM|nr:glycosyltransferase [Shewanella corallii]MCL2914036.1 glycosyltransferase [Shewanella corallii]
MKHSANEKLPILYIHYGDPWFRGSENCLITLLKLLDRDIYQPILWTNNPVLASQAQAMGVDTHVEEFSLLLGWKAPKWSFSGWWKLYLKCRDLIRHYGVSLVHCNSAAPIQWALIAAKTMDVPMLCHLHSPYPVRDKISLGLYLCPTIVGVSKMTTHSIERDGYPASCARVIYNAIDYSAIKNQPSKQLRTELGLSSSDILLASVGSLIPRKRMDKLIRVTANLKAKGHPVHLMLIGSGPELMKLKSLTAELNLEKQVHFVGEQTQIGSCLKGGVDIYVTCPEEEAFGLTILEALSLKVPVVAARVGGIPELIDADETGVLSEGDINSFTDAVDKLIRDPAKRKTMAQTGALRAYSRFGTEHFYHEFHRLYQSMIYQSGHYQNPFILAKLAAMCQAACRSVLRVLGKKLSLTNQVREV